MAAPTGREAVQVMIQLPSPLRDALKASAAQNDRSLATEIYHRLKANGPAEGATSPSHDPNHHHQEKAMGIRSDTTTPAPAASDKNWFEMAGRFESALGTILIIAGEASTTLIRETEYSHGDVPVCTIAGAHMDRAIAFLRAVEDIATLVQEPAR